MKIRQGFVSNSSSSSFVIFLDCISNKQEDAIRNHIQYAIEKLGWKNDDADFRDEWNIEVRNGYIEGSTFLNNFDMEKLLIKLGVKDDDIKWGD